MPLLTLKRMARPIVCPFEPILEQIPSGSFVFDIGCGGGFLLGLVAKTKAPSRLAGVEIHSDLVRTAEHYIREQAPELSVRISVYDGVTLPITIGEADVILMVDVFHHIPLEQQDNFLSAIHRSMRAGAKLVLKDIDAGRPVLCACNKLHDLLVSGECGHEIAMTTMEEKLTSLGFRIENRGSQCRLWYPHYWFTCAKG
jgi:cyclopropane fatty-acyl-phospholipid synthase-like methyltransferase